MRDRNRKTLVLGLDLGGTKIAAGVVESTGKLHSAVRLPTPASGVRRDLAALFNAAHSAVASAGAPWAAIRAVGVGVPGAFDPVTETVWAPNLPGWQRVPLKRLLEKTLARPAFIEGDRNVQALAEAWLGAGRKHKIGSLVFLTVGTGIGAGLILEGRVVSGQRGLAGAAGWLAVERDWKPEFARVGCLEALSAGPALARLARQALRRAQRSVIRELAVRQPREGRVTGETVVEAARRGDHTARRILERVGDDLGRGVANIVSLLNPEVVVLGGGLAGAGEFLLQPLRRAVLKWGQPLASRQVRITRTRLGEDAGILGAARYALLKLEDMS
jgi:glucokinase